MQLISLVSWLLRRRLRHSWLLLAVTSFGILASVIIMSTGALYSRALGEAGLRHTVASFSPEVHNVQVISQNRPLGRPDYGPLQSLLDQSSTERLGEMLRVTERFGRTQSNLTLLSTPTSAILGSPSGRPFFLTGFAEHSTLLQGRWPESGEYPDSGSESDIEIALGSETSRKLNYLVGDRIFLIPRRGAPDRIAFKVVGIVEPIDSNEEYWMGAPNHFDLNSVGESVVVPIYINEDDFFDGIGGRYPTLVGDFGFLLFLDSGLLTIGNINEVRSQVLGLETDLNKVYPRTLVLSRLGLTIDQFGKALTLAKIPLYLYLSLVVVVVLYFLALITGTLGRSQAGEAGLLRSRGASIMQVSAVLALAEAGIAVVAMAVGPFLAWIIVKTLLLDTINPGGEFATPIPLGLSGDMFWMGALGGVMALVVLLFTAVGRARMGTLELLMSRTRPPSVSFLHRYYLDILAVATVVLIWFQVRGRNGFVAEGLESQGINVDPTLVLGPVLGLFAAAVLLLRVLPLLVGLLAWAGTRVGAAWFQFSLLRLARDPIPHGSLAVILMLAAALGVFGATFQSSLSQAQSDQAHYSVGGNMVVRGPGLPENAPQKLEKVTGVTAVTGVSRDSVSVLEGLTTESVGMLALDPRSLAKTTWFRDDFFPGGLPAISRLLRPRPFATSLAGTGIPLPEDSTALGVWVDSSALLDKNLQFDVNMWARVLTATGFYRTFPMGNILDQGNTDSGDAKAVDGRWKLFTGDLSVFGQASQPLELVSLFFSTAPSNRLSDGVILLDDVTAFSPATGSRGVLPAGVLIEGFEGQAPWQPLANQGLTPDTTLALRDNSRSGGSGLRFAWTEPISNGQRGIHLPPGPFPLPAIGGPDFQVGQQVRVKLGNLAVPIEIVGVTSHFPTLKPGRKPFFITDLTGYQEYARRLPLGVISEPNEMWLAVDEDADRDGVIVQIDEVIAGLISVRDAEAVASLAERNPLAGGAWNGLTIFSMIAIGIAVLLTLTVHALVSIKMGRMDLAVAQALGFSRRQSFLSLATERMIIAVLAIAAGAAMGYWPGLEILELMDLTPQGDAPVLPLLPSVQGWLMAGVLVGLLAAAALSVAFAVVATRRLNTAEVLRGGT
jgi:ABC-type antimicrobial peptide transport system permease subunit